MTKKELKTAKDNEVIFDYINTFATWYYNYNCGGGIKRTGEHLRDLDDEMLKRGLLTKEQVDMLNS